MVYAYGPSRDPDDCSVAQDNVESGCLAVRHLLSCGRTRIAIIAGDSEYSVAHERMRVRSRPYMMLDYSWLAKRGSVHGKRNGGAPLPVCCSMTVAAFDAVICQNDVLARGCIEELERSGCRYCRKT